MLEIVILPGTLSGFVIVNSSSASHYLRLDASAMPVSRSALLLGSN